MNIEQQGVLKEKLTCTKVGRDSTVYRRLALDSA